MKKFIRNVFLLLIIVGGVFTLLSVFDYYVIGNQYDYGYLASLENKVERLKSINEPKIILVGHSNLAFGMDSEMLEDATGMPVVNLGLHGGLGNSFHEELAKFNIREGDLVIVCHSSFSDADDSLYASLAWMAIGKNIELWKTIGSKYYIGMIKGYPKYLKKDYVLWITGEGHVDDGGSYSVNAFNEYGDVVVKPEEDQLDIEEYFPDAIENHIEVPVIDDASVQRINEYNEYITERGATLLIAGYPIAYGKYASFTESDFVEFKSELENRMDCDIISDYTDYFYPYEYFYDTGFHLTEEGTAVRTAQLISDIERWQADH